ncbi:MAG TPA: carbohydrate ABC transporter permease, partial [Firmicutes bacterium]|nr:carbohydrate ABC transporter permease [Bacillota bacterium]
QWNTMMAAVVMATLPMIVILFLAQSFFIQGIQFSGMNR